MFQMRTVPSEEAVVRCRRMPSTLKPSTASVCDLISVLYLRLLTSRNPKLPVEVPARTRRLSDETDTRLTGPSCSGK